MGVARELPKKLIDTLPPGAFSPDCPSGDFDCEHWAHGTNQEGLYIFSPQFDAFMAEKARECRK